MKLLEYMDFMKTVKFNTQFIEIWMDGESQGREDVETNMTIFPNPYITDIDMKRAIYLGFSQCEIDSIGDGLWDSQIIYLKYDEKLYSKFGKTRLKTALGTIDFDKVYRGGADSEKR